ncbi:MAG TPA: Ku protein [Candidatus Saccharimonadales bacterium]|jgi:DNA end-binding protein Ku|nr:Ku protein [Candidatus Saccharimonadales bacterium]
MSQAVWTGSISFGLVSIPVRLYPATQPKDVRFHLYDRQSGKRIRYERVTREYEPPSFIAEDHDEISEGSSEVLRPFAQASPAEPLPAPVDTADVIRGYELPNRDVIPISEDELEALAPERSRTIEIEEFVDLAEIDPVFFEKSYFVAPTRDTAGDKSYLLLLRAMQATGMVGIGRFVLRTKPHLVAIRPLGSVLGLETLYFGDEVRKAEDVARLPAVALSDRELKMAEQLVKALAAAWVPDKHADEYREELLELLRSKRAWPRGESTAPAVSGATVEDLMATLKASVEAAKRKNEAAAKPRRRAEGHRTG